MPPTGATAPQPIATTPPPQAVGPVGAWYTANEIMIYSLAVDASVLQAAVNNYWTDSSTLPGILPSPSTLLNDENAVSNDGSTLWNAAEQAKRLPAIPNTMIEAWWNIGLWNIAVHDLIYAGATCNVQPPADWAVGDLAQGQDLLATEINDLESARANGQ